MYIFFYCTFVSEFLLSKSSLVYMTYFRNLISRLGIAITQKLFIFVRYAHLTLLISVKRIMTC